MKRNHSALLALALIVCLFGAISSLAAVHYVNANGSNAAPPYTNWVTAATNIQDAVSVASANDTIIVTNGVYPGLVQVTNALALVSVNGPLVTLIKGGLTNRCAYLTADGASMTGFTLTNGYNRNIGGGGVFCSSRNVFLTNCIITGNITMGHWWTFLGGSIYEDPSYGGGVCEGTLHNCMLTRNSADGGGGAADSILYNCTLSDNSGITTGEGQYYHFGSGGGVYNCRLYNCIVYYNQAASFANYTGSTLEYCCTTPLPADGVGNIADEPLYVDTNGWNNLHLQTNSPGINTGNNDYVTTATDLDGNPRIAGGTVDMGAYEFQPCITGGQFCDAACSHLTGFSFTFSGAIVGQSYRIQTSTNLAAGSWTDLTNFNYTGPVVITDPSAVAGPKKFYRAVSP